MIGLLVQNFALVLAMMILLWGVSIALKDVSFIDAFWAFGFVFVAIATFAATPGAGARKGLIVAVTLTWGLRLGAYLLWRWRREGPDKRYLALIKRAGGNPHLVTLRMVFLLQAALLFCVSLPVQLGQLGNSASLGLLAILGAALASVGILFETVGDAQLARFKANPSNDGRVLDTGLWRYTRHPNYFGDLCVWWGLFLIAAEAPLGGLSIAGPLLLTWILLRVSGASLLERRLHRSREGYATYVERTNRIFPWAPRV